MGYLARLTHYGPAFFVAMLPALVTGWLCLRKARIATRDDRVRSVALVGAVSLLGGLAAGYIVAFASMPISYRFPPADDYVPLTLSFGATGLVAAVSGFLADAARVSPPQGSSKGRTPVLGRSASLAAGMIAIAMLTSDPVISRLASSESSAIASLIVCEAGQDTFRLEDRYGIGKCVFANTTHGRGYFDLFSYRRAGTEQEHVISLIGQSLAEAHAHIDEIVAESNLDKEAFGSALHYDPVAGYYYIDITGSVEGSFDYTREHGLCAYPVRYGRTGQYTFIGDSKGRLYGKDNGGQPVTCWPDTDRDGWVAVEWCD